MIVGLPQGWTILTEVTGLLDGHGDGAGKNNFNIGTVCADPASEGKDFVTTDIKARQERVDCSAFAVDNLMCFFSVDGLKDEEATLSQVLRERVSHNHLGLNQHDTMLDHRLSGLCAPAAPGWSARLALARTAYE